MPSRRSYAERFGLGRWQTCPVCHGKGAVPEGFYLSQTPVHVSTGTATETCRTCDGRGIVK